MIKEYYDCLFEFIEGLRNFDSQKHLNPRYKLVKDPTDNYFHKRPDGAYSVFVYDTRADLSYTIIIGTPIQELKKELTHDSH